MAVVEKSFHATLKKREPQKYVLQHCSFNRMTRTKATSQQYKICKRLRHLRATTQTYLRQTLVGNTLMTNG